MRIVTIIGGPAFSQNLIGEQVRSRDPEDSSGSLIRGNGSAGLFFLPNWQRESRCDTFFKLRIILFANYRSKYTILYQDDRPLPARIRVNRTGASFRKSWHKIHLRNDHSCGVADLFILSFGEYAAPASFTRSTPEPPLHSLFNESAEFFAVERPQERARINTTAAAMPLCFRPFFSIDQYRARRQ